MFFCDHDSWFDSFFFVGEENKVLKQPASSAINLYFNIMSAQKHSNGATWGGS